MDLILDVWLWTTTLVTVASAIAAITPTKKDDAFMSKIKPIINAIALNIGNAKGGK